MQIVIVWWECRLEGDQTDTGGKVPEVELKQIVDILH